MRTKSIALLLLQLLYKSILWEETLMLKGKAVHHRFRKLKSVNPKVALWSDESKFKISGPKCSVFVRFKEKRSEQAVPEFKLPCEALEEVSCLVSVFFLHECFGW